MSALKNLYFDLVPFSYYEAFYEGFKESLQDICKRMLACREYEKVKAIACEYAERVGQWMRHCSFLNLMESWWNC